MKRKFLASVLAASMLMTVLTGCGDTEVKSSEVSSEVQTTSETTASSEAIPGFEHDPILNEVGVEPISKETVTLTIGIRQNSLVENYDTNKFTLWLEEMANVNLEFMEFPNKEMGEKIRLMAAAGGSDLPDIIIHGFDDATVFELGSNGIILPLEDYYENSSVYYKEGFEKVLNDQGVNLYKFITAADGHIYNIPKYNETLTNPAYARIWVYQPWLDAVGMKAEDIVTTDDFYNMLNAFKTQDPNGNGKADEIPAFSSDPTKAGSAGGAFIDAMMGAFLPCTSLKNHLIATDGQLSIAINQEAYKEGIKYLNSLCSNGLYDPVSFTTSADNFKMIMNNEGDQLVGCFVNLSPSFVQKTHGSYGKWTLLEPLTGPDGVCTTPYKPDIPTNGAYITANCEHPELAFRLLDLMGKEDVAISSRWGIEGENWSYTKDLEGAGYDFSKTFSDYPAYFYQTNNIWNIVQNNHWQNVNPSFRTAEVVGSYYAGMVSNSAEGDYNLELAAKLSSYEAVKPAEPITSFIYSSEVQAEANELANAINDYVNEKKAQWITGAADVDAEWENYLKELDKMGLPRYLELTQEAYDNMK